MATFMKAFGSKASNTLEVYLLIYKMSLRPEYGNMEEISCGLKYPNITQNEYKENIMK